MNNQLLQYVERIERLEEEKKAIADDIRDVYLEAKSKGFDVKAMRTVVKMRKLEEAARVEQQAIVETYMRALGMLAETPLGEAAIRAATKPRNGYRQLTAEATDEANTKPHATKGGADNAPPLAVEIARTDVSAPPFLLPEDDMLDIPADMRRALP